MRWRSVLARTAGGLIATGAVLFAGLQTSLGQGWLAAIVSSLASTADRRVELSGLAGFFPTDLRIGLIELSDRQGVWLRVEDADIQWSFTSLFDGRLKIDTLASRRIEVLRPPQPVETRQSSSLSDGGLGPPIGVDLGRLAIEDLHIAAAMGGVDSRWKLSGTAALTADRMQSRLRLAMNRTDGPVGRVSADIRFDLGHFMVDGEVSADEEDQGLFAALIGRPDLNRVSLHMAGKGDAAEGAVEFSASAGDAVTSNGATRWHHDGAATAISARLITVAPGLPDGPLARLLRTPITFDGEATLDDAGVLVARQLSLNAGPARLAASGRYDSAADKLDATATIDAGEAGALADLLGGATWRDLHLELRAELAGLAKRPQGLAAFTASANDISLASLDEHAPALGHVQLTTRLGVRPDGRLTVEAFQATSPLASLQGEGSYLPSAGLGDGKATIDMPDLAALSALAGMPLTGRGHLELSLRAADGGAGVKWQGAFDHLGLPNVPPGLFDPTITLSGGGSLGRDEAWALEAVRLASEGVSLQLAGRGRGHAGEVDLSLALPRLTALGNDMSGAATATAKVTLRPSGGDLRLAAELSDLAHLGFTSHKLSLVVESSLEGKAATGNVRADGDLAGQPLALRGNFARAGDGGLSVPGLQGSWASASIDVANLSLTPTGATGAGHLKIARLQDFATLVGADLAGTIGLDVETDPQAAARKLHVVLRGDGLRSGGAGVGSLRADATVSDPFGAATAEADITASRIGGMADIGRLNAKVKGDRHGVDITLQAAGSRTNASFAAWIEPMEEEVRIALSRFDGRYLGIPLALAGPARLSAKGSRMSIEPATFRLGGGHLSVRGVVDATTSDLTVDIAALPLTLIETLAPGSGLDGTLQAKVRLTGPQANPRIEATYSADGLRLRSANTALLPSLALRGSASVVERRATFDTHVTAGSATDLALKGNATLPQHSAPLAATARLTGALDIGPFAPLLGNSVSNVAGTLRPDVTLSVTDRAVKGSGTISLAGAALSAPPTGLRLSGGEASIALQGNTLQLQHLRFHTPGNGEITANGTAHLDPTQGIAFDLGIAAHQALLANRPDLIATVSSDLKVMGSIAGGVDVSGPITVDRAEIAIGGDRSANYPTVAVREINRPGVTDRGPPTASGPAPAGATPIRLALSVQAPQAVFVRGHGLNAEVGGQFKVNGDPAAPSVLGSLSLRRGDFTIAGHRLVFSRGNVSLMNANTIDPQLDFLATTSVGATSIEVAITGTARAPKLALTSIPALPQDEAMALLLFGKPASVLSPTELLQAAQAVAELTGGSTEGGVAGRLRRSLGLDQLTINSSGQTASTTSVEGGRYVAPGVYVGAKQGASTGSSRGVVEVEVFKHTKIEGDIGADSTGRIGAKMEWDY